VAHQLTSLAEELKGLARAQGLDALGFAPAGPFEGYSVPGSSRRDPALTLPGARSLVVAGIYIGGFGLQCWERPDRARLSRLVLAGYFADVVEPLKPLAGLLRKRGFRTEICDGLESGRSILPLKLAAVRAGLGWQGRNSLLLSRRFGTFLALGGLVTEAELKEEAAPERDRCGTCRACQEACPTKALEEPYRLDKSRCLSHLLDRKEADPALLGLAGNRVLECETCQLVCPWNRKHLDTPLATPGTEAFLQAKPELEDGFRLEEMIAWSEADYRAWAGPLRLPVDFEIFRRNVIAAFERSGLGR